LLRATRAGQLKCRTMDHRAVILAAAMAAVILSPWEVRAQSVVEAVRMGLDNSYILQAERERHNALIEGQVQVRNLRRPNIQLEATSNIRQRAALNAGTYLRDTTEPGSLSLSAVQPLVLGGRYQAAMREADLRVAQSVARIRGRELSVVREIIEAYADVRRDYQVSEIRADGVTWLTDQLAGTRARQKEGLVGLTEVSQVETRLASARRLATNAQARLQSSWAILERRMGARPAGLTEDEIHPDDLPDTLLDAIDLAIANSNVLKASRFDEDIARAAARRIQAENGPRVNLQASVSGRSDSSFNGDRDYDAQIGVRFVMPLWSGGQPQSRARAALAESNAARFDAIADERLLTEQVTTAWARLNAARNSKAIAEELVRAAQVARRGAELEFEIGLRSIIEVLNQEQELQEARAGFESAKAELMAAQAALSSLIGLDPTGVINERTQFDPSKMAISYATAAPGKLAVWERPLVTVFEVVDDAQLDTRSTINALKRSIFGPEL
jgi:outer membrane protein